MLKVATKNPITKSGTHPITYPWAIINTSPLNHYQCILFHDVKCNCIEFECLAELGRIFTLTVHNRATYLRWRGAKIRMSLCIGHQGREEGQLCRVTYNLGTIRGRWAASCERLVNWNACSYEEDALWFSFLMSISLVRSTDLHQILIQTCIPAQYLVVGNPASLNHFDYCQFWIRHCIAKLSYVYLTRGIGLNQTGHCTCNGVCKIPLNRDNA